MELNTDFFNLINLKDVDLSGKIATIKYANFDDFNMDFYVDWSIDPYGVLNWRHNFLSLRWIDFKLNKKNIKLILASFYYFHYLKQNENNMIFSRLGDHTTAIRVSVLRRIRRLFLADNEPGFIFLCEFLIKKDLDALISDKVYRNGHNHGVIADTEILNTIDDLGIKDYLDASLIVDRGFSSLKSLFTSDGITMEHSVSYQEYNYPVAIEFLKSARNFSANKNFNYQVLEESTVDLIRYFSRSNGEFFPLGDSFREGNKSIRKNFLSNFDLSPAINSLAPESQSLYCKNGFFSYVRNFSNLKVQFVSVCSWNSYHHKQDDELSFCFEIDGNLVFDDPGYSDMVSKNDLDMLRSAESHSTVTIVGKEFSKKNSSPKGSTFTSWKEHSNGFYLQGQHSRIENILVTRVYEILERRLSIIDTIESPSDIFTKHGFILGQGIGIEIKDRQVFLNKNGASLGVLSAEEQGHWLISQIISIDSNRKNINKSIRLQYVLEKKSKCVFNFDF
ncbi:heparinase II/III family protein [Alcaligenes nematophilus]|uniref:heparinase II/III domain-containing protein n=1 Tax=Alcaligenes nematophilus TaxID=2994643 RepID=UPI002465A85A|nr:heparinase II/III family protein [Alcaligenes nematophilus]MDH4865635.1 heparinase II/III family protein [Bacillus cereus]MDY7126933.1 heparinase II/III family protein [Alcaligenes nematophilus]